PTTTGSKPAAERCRAMPSAITLSSSTISTFATTPTIVAIPVLPGFRTGDDLVKGIFKRKQDVEDVEMEPVAAEPLPTPSPPIDDQAFTELRTGFTAAVSHELRTPLARILVLLDSADLPGADVPTLIDQILFLSELESGKEVVSLGRTAALPIVESVVTSLETASARAGVDLRAA